MTLERINELSIKVANNDLSEKDIKDLLQILKMQAMEKAHQENKVNDDLKFYHNK